MAALSREEIAAVVEHQRRNAAGPLVVLWATLSTSRTEALTHLQERWRGEPIIPLRVSGARFTDPNSVGNDLVTLLEESRAEVEAHLTSLTSRESPLVLLLLSYRELAIPQVDSPVQVPAWLLSSENVLTVPIIDITWEVSASLAATPSLGDISRLLVEIEEALQRRIFGAQVSQAAELASIRKFPGFLNGADEAPAQILRTSKEALSRIGKAEDFRPCLKPRRTLIERLYGIAQSCTHSQLGSAARALALDLRFSSSLPTSHEVTIVSVLHRQHGALNPGELAALDLIAHVAVAARLLTAAHHAGDYPLFPPIVLRALSYELRRSLNSLCHLLQTGPS